MLTSIGAIDADGWLLEFRGEEVTVAKAMLANGRRRILVADNSKFGKVASCKLAHIGEMTTLVTDQPPSKSFRRLMKEGGCDLVIALGARESQIAPISESRSTTRTQVSWEDRRRADEPIRVREAKTIAR